MSQDYYQVKNTERNATQSVVRKQHHIEIARTRVSLPQICSECKRLADSPVYLNWVRSGPE
jgi:hypothetical protein